jgi:hypothetical protein
MWRPPHASFLLAAALLFCPALQASPQRYPTLPAPAFEFHSGFWVNLHHFLYQQGRLRRAAADVPPVANVDPSGAGTADAQPASLDGLTPAQQKDWNAAVATYASNWSSFELLDNNLALIDDRLAELENCADLDVRGDPSQCISGLQRPMVAALKQAAPLYRARWWPQQDRENRAWIEAVAPLVRQMGDVVGNELTQVYLTPWPQGVLHVDVVGYAGPQGAYTSLLPLHIVISSHDPRNQGMAAFEVLFLEASTALAQDLNGAIAAQCRRLDIPIPRDLWQAMLFYTTGELTRRFVEANPAVSGGAPYVPYAYRNGLFARGWSNYQPLLQRYWQPYLDGQIGFDAAISRILTGLV